MLGTIALISTVLARPAIDKVNFAHNFTSGQTVAYELNFKGNGDSGDMEVNAAFSILFGDKAAKGTNVTIKPKTLKMNTGGQEMDQSSSVGDTKFVLDEHGMPDSITMNGEEGILIIPLVLSYLPNKELEVGDTFDIDFKQDTTTFKGTGKFDGMETVGDKSLPKISIKASLNPGGGGEGQLDYVIFFDKDSGHVALLKGKADVDNQEFVFVLTKK